MSPHANRPRNTHPPRNTPPITQPTQTHTLITRHTHNTQSSKHFVGYTLTSQDMHFVPIAVHCSTKRACLSLLTISLLLSFPFPSLSFSFLPLSFLLHPPHLSLPPLPILFIDFTYIWRRTPPAPCPQDASVWWRKTCRGNPTRAFSVSRRFYVTRNVLITKHPSCATQEPSVPWVSCLWCRAPAGCTGLRRWSPLKRMAAMLVLLVNGMFPPFPFSPSSFSLSFFSFPDKNVLF